MHWIYIQGVCGWAPKTIPPFLIPVESQAGGVLEPTVGEATQVRGGWRCKIYGRMFIFGFASAALPVSLGVHPESKETQVPGPLLCTGSGYVSSGTGLRHRPQSHRAKLQYHEGLRTSRERATQEVVQNSEIMYTCNQSGVLQELALAPSKPQQTSSVWWPARGVRAQRASGISRLSLGRKRRAIG